MCSIDQQGNSVILVEVCKLQKNRFFLKEFKRISSTLVNNAVPRGHGLANESRSAKHGLPPHNVLIKETSKLFKTMQAIVIAIGCPSDLDCETLFMVTPHSLIIGHREVNLTRKRSPW